MTNDETIQKVRQAMQDAMNYHGPFSGTDQARHICEALTEAGLLAPTPLTEEWAVWGDLPELWGTDETFNSKQSAEQWIRDNEWAGRGGGRAVHRHISDWGAVE